MLDVDKNAKTYRALLLVGASIYLVWWLAVHLILPTAINPFASRAAVAVVLIAIWGVSFFNKWVRGHISALYALGVWLITAHYYYLFYINAGESNWVVGSYITVIAISLTLWSPRALLLYSILVTVLSAAVFLALPETQHSVFLPGIITILIQANFTARARYNAEREKQRARALAENVRIRDEFISIASHELKTPLTALKLQSETLARDIKNDKIRLYSPERVEESVTALNNRIARLVNLVETLLNVSQISANRLILEKQTLDLAMAVREMAKAVSMQAKSENLPLDLQVVAPETLVVHADPTISY